MLRNILLVFIYSSFEFGFWLLLFCQCRRNDVDYIVNWMLESVLEIIHQYNCFMAYLSFCIY
jgi:hypothetical protein